MALLILLFLLPSPSHSHPTCQVSKVASLLQVNCENRNLTALPEGLPADTGVLLLSSNRLGAFSTAAVAHLGHLAELILEHCGLSSLQTPARLQRLESLSLAHNDLQSLPPLGEALPALSMLDLSFNQLGSLSPRALDGLSHLCELYLQNNKLRGLPPGLLETTTKLEKLNLANNKLGELPPGLLHGLQALDTLYLHGNWLRTVPRGFFEGLPLPYVFLHSNPWYCDCESLYLRQWLQNNPTSVYLWKAGVDVKAMTSNVASVRCANLGNAPMYTYPGKGCPTSLGDTDSDDYYDSFDVPTTGAEVKLSTGALAARRGLLSASPTSLGSQMTSLPPTHEPSKKQPPSTHPQIPGLTTLPETGEPNTVLYVSTSTPTSPAPTTSTLTSPAPSTSTPTSPAPSTSTLTSPAPSTSTPTSPAPSTSTPTSPAPRTSTLTSPALSTSTPTSPASTTTSTLTSPAPSMAPAPTTTSTATSPAPSMAPAPTTTSTATSPVPSMAPVPVTSPPATPETSSTTPITPAPGTPPMPTTSTPTSPAPSTAPAPSTPTRTSPAPFTSPLATLEPRSTPPNTAAPTVSPVCTPLASPESSPTETNVLLFATEVTPLPALASTTATPGWNGLLNFRMMAQTNSDTLKSELFLHSDFCCLLPLGFYILGLLWLLSACAVLTLLLTRIWRVKPHSLASGRSESTSTHTTSVEVQRARQVTVPRAGLLFLQGSLPTFRSSLSLWVRPHRRAGPLVAGRRPSALSQGRGEDLLGTVAVRYSGHSL